jgi:UV DNA damage endonuclease
MTSSPRPLRLGFPVKVMGKPDLKSNDTRGWRKNPHLKCSLEHVDKILDYLAKVGIDFYRFSSDLAPYATHPDMPQFHNMVAESDAELAAFGKKVRDLDIRVGFHPSQYVLLNAPNPELTRKSIWDLSSQAEMLDRMGIGPEGGARHPCRRRLRRSRGQPRAVDRGVGAMSRARPQPAGAGE